MAGLGLGAGLGCAAYAAYRGYQAFQATREDDTKKVEEKCADQPIHESLANTKQLSKRLGADLTSRKTSGENAQPNLEFENEANEVPRKRSAPINIIGAHPTVISQEVQRKHHRYMRCNH